MPPDVRVSQPTNTRPAGVAIAIDPTNPARLVVGSNLDWVYYSWDGGRSWEERELHSEAFGVWGDPSAAFDSAGRAYYAHLSNTPDPGYWLDRIVVQRSTDGGATFETARVSESSFTASTTLFLGDSIGIAARDGRIHTVWTRMDGETLSIWSTFLDERTFFSR